MSESPTQSSDAAELERLRRELVEKADLVQSVRTELIRAQITVLELQDTVLQKETDKADAVSLLGQAELTLEGKINTIFELDRVLNEKITQLQHALAQAAETHAADRASRDAIAQDLVQKLDQANRALGDAHALAGRYAREASENQQKHQTALQAAENLREELELWRGKADAASVASTATQQRLNTTEAARAHLERELATIHASFAWKVTKPLRALGGPKP